MLLDLKELLASDRESTSVSYPLDLHEIEIAGGHPFCSPVAVTACASNRSGIITVELDADFVYTAPCDRCMAPVERRYRYHFSHRVIQELAEDENDDYIEAPDLSLDLDELVSTDILLELPSKFLCRGDCQGLCQKCGHNLNLGDCDCDKAEIDPRLESLKELLND